jgi:aminopeptidase N
MYNKGNNMLHTLRQVVSNDEQWKAMLRGLNKEFYHQTVTTKQVEEYMAKALDLNLTAFFNQYLRDNRIPVLEYFVKDGTLTYRWSNCISSFDMPVKVTINGEEKILKPRARPQFEKFEKQDVTVKVDPNYYVYTFNTMGN